MHNCMQLHLPTFHAGVSEWVAMSDYIIYKAVQKLTNLQRALQKHYTFTSIEWYNVIIMYR